MPIIPSLSPVVQRVALSGASAIARARLGRGRARPAAPFGVAEYLTAVVRLGADVVPVIEADDHYVYPPHTVHVTITNLDAATVEFDEGLTRVRDLALRAPTFTIAGLGCSPDTLFLRCIHDRAYDELRDSVRRAFGMRTERSVSGWLFDRLAYANVVRFDGRGRWLDVDLPRTTVTCRELEIVRTDRYLSDAATSVLARLPLATTIG